MAGMLSEQDAGVLPNSNSKKRKRDTVQVGDFQHSINNTFRIIPSHLHNFGALIHCSYTSPLKQSNECPPRLGSLSRKRRALQQPGFYPQPSLQSVFAQHKSIPQSSYLHADLHASAPSGSPRTQIPSAPQQNPCTSPSFLRPCHICHRRPTTRELVQAYADCELCGQRACFICLRRCDAVNCWGRGSQEEQQLWGATASSPPPDKSMGVLQDSLSRIVCSSCTVEGVTDTGMEVVRCLACIR
ncbi:hypothetical protein BDW68DRAFT_168515 [Aspergillus falconensis]